MPGIPHVLREYALLADGERGAVVGPRGDIAWLCFPGWADPAIMTTLLGGAGVYDVTPVGRFVWGGYYEEGSLIWRSRWITTDAVIECREALAYPGERDRLVLLRRLQLLDGTAAVDLHCAPAHDYGRREATDVRRDDRGDWCGRLGTAGFRWSGAADATPSDDGLHLRLELREGDQHDLVFVVDRSGDAAPVDPGPAWDTTQEAWERACPPVHRGFAGRDARHARAVLRGLTSGAGAMVAAATMSLPERADEGRAYDYRYAWLRDQSIAGQAAARAGAYDLLDGAVTFTVERLLADGPDLAPAYTVDGGRVPDECSLGLPGYPGGADIVGNHANDQFQLDVFGEALLLLGTAAREDRVDARAADAVRIAADAIAARRAEPDAGIWELDPKLWTHSRLICAAGLRAAAPLLGHGEEHLALADDLVRSAALHPSGRWQRAPDDPRVDAALLFAGVRGATAPDDPRAVATLDAVLRELREDGYVYRYRAEDRPLGQAEGAFLLCGLLCALALHDCGRHIEAARMFERNRAACGPPGLLTEEFDVDQRQLRGNLPQAFVHALVLECAVVLDRVAPQASMDVAT